MMCSSTHIDHEDSFILFRLMGVFGYSAEEINIRRLKSRYFDLCSKLFLPNKALRYLNFAGSHGEGLEGNKRTLDEIPTDIDEIQVKTYPEIYDTDINTCDCLCSIKNCLKSHVHIERDIQYPGYVRLYTKNEDMKGKMSVPNTIMPKNTNWDREILIDLLRIELNGPAVTLYPDIDAPWSTARHDSPKERVLLLFHNKFPIEASEFLSRERPNQWPSNETIRKIETKGCFVAPVGNFDSSEKHLQWRISFHGEKQLFSNLNHIQILCYVILKWILKIEIKPVAKDSLKSYHLKHAVFWSVQLLQCEWTPANLLSCLRICVNQTKMYVSDRLLPHFVIKKRNIFNSKLTKAISENVVCILEKYNTNISKIFELHMFKMLINQKDDWTIFTNDSITYTYFGISMTILSRLDFFFHHIIWIRYEKHNAAKSLQNYQQILSKLYSNKTVFFLPMILYVQSMLGLLSYSLYKETLRSEYLMYAREFYIKTNKPCLIPYIPILLRDIMFLYMRNMYKRINYIFKNSGHFEMEMEPTLREGDLLLRQLLKQHHEYVESLGMPLDLNELLALKKSVKDAFFCFGDYSYKEVTSSAVERRIADVMKRLPYDLRMFKCVNVVFMSAEKWGVAEVIQLELFSFFEFPEWSFSGIFLTSYLCWKVLAFITNYQMGNMQDNLDILRDMERYLKRCEDNYRKNPNHCLAANSAAYEPIYLSYNIVAYCKRKAKWNKQAIKHILQSIKVFPCRRNSAWGYIKCIIMILRDTHCTISASDI